MRGGLKRIGAAGKEVPERRRRWWTRAALLLMVFAAYALRVSTLTMQSMWIDEAMAMVFTQGSFDETVRTIVRPEHNGPLFYLLLFGWRHLVGESDFAVRYLSAFCSVLTLPVLYRWARRLTTERTALLAVWLLACSPFALWFAQEAKMYALHMLTATASSLALLEAFRKGGWWRWGAYLILASATLYSHFFGGFLVASQAAMALLLGWRRWKRLLSYAAAMTLLALAHLPLLRVGLRIVSAYEPVDSWRGFVPLHGILKDMLVQYFGRLVVTDTLVGDVFLPAALIVAGTLALLWLRRRDAGMLPLHAFLPLLIFYPISFQVPVYQAKYLAAALPALFILAAWGIEALARLWRPLGLLVLALGALMLAGVVRDLTTPEVQRGDWRFVAAYVEQHEGPRDVVLISAFYNTHAFERYYRGRSAVIGFKGDPYDPLPYFNDLTQNYDRLWLVLHQDQAMAPGNHLRAAGDLLFPLMTEQFPNAGQVALLGYEMRLAYPALPAAAQPLDVCFENGLCLAGYHLDATRLPPTERLVHPPSNWIHVTLYWRRDAQVSDIAFRPLVRLIDGSFAVWGGNLERHPDVFERYPPPELWPMDVVVETHFDINLNPVTPPGLYRLEVSLAMDGDEQRRVAVVNPAPGMPPDRFVFESIEIVPECR